MRNNTTAKMKLIAYQFKEREVRSISKDGEPWFVAKDVCDTLGIKNAPQAVESLDDDEKGICFGDTLGGKQKMVIVSEPGLYRLISRSNKPQAKAFLRWVTHEVLPAIRKTGGYGGPGKRMPTSTELAMMVIKRDQQLGVSREMLDIISPDYSKYGEPGRSGEPRVKICRASLVSGKGRLAHAACLITLNGQLDLQLNAEDGQ